MKRRIAAAEFVAVIVLMQIDVFTIASKMNYCFIPWVVCCLALVVSFVDRLRKLTTVKNLFSILNSAFNTIYPFIFVVVMTYFILAFIGMALFGGKINSSLPEKYLQSTGEQLLRNYQFLNWNDLLNALTCLYTLQIGNQTPILLNMAAIARNPVHRDYSGLFFLLVIVVNDMILFNLFIGSIISICLDSFEQEKNAQEHLDETHEDPFISTKSDYN